MKIQKRAVRECDFCGEEVRDHPGYHICRECTIEMLYNAYYNHYRITGRTYERVKVYQIDREEIRRQARADRKKLRK